MPPLPPLAAPCWDLWGACRSACPSIVHWAHDRTRPSLAPGGAGCGLERERTPAPLPHGRRVLVPEFEAPAQPLQQDQGAANGGTPEDPTYQRIQLGLQAAAAAAAPANGAAPDAEAAVQGRRLLRFVLQRRLRLVTVPMPVVSRPDQVFKYVDCESVLWMLLHKVLRAAREEGLAESRALLKDWLVLLLSCTVITRAEAGITTRGPIPSVEDLLRMLPEGPPPPVPGLPGAAGGPGPLPPSLQPLPRMVYALLRGPLLNDPTDAASLDRRSFLSTLWSSLSPEEVARAGEPPASLRRRRGPAP